VSVLPRALKKRLDMPPKAAAQAYKIVVARAARDDLEDILEWTTSAFGNIGRKRYEALIQAALTDLAANPSRTGIRQRSDIGKGICTYHLSSSRKRASTSTQVAKPRHLIFFRVNANVIQILRLLHDTMDFAQHLPDVA
jgi:toxin ParE1/3/4